MGFVRQSASDASIAFEKVAPTAGGLTVTWTDGHESFFHAAWLRDCCYCDACGDCYSSNRYVVPSDIPDGIAVSTAEIRTDGTLSVTWSPDGHQSSYSPDWLRQHCYDDASRAARRHRPTLWDARLTADLPEVDFATLEAQDDARLSFYRNIRDLGFAVVRGGPSDPGSVETVAELIGGMTVSAYGAIFDLAPKSPIPTLGNTQRPVPPHTDEPFRYAPPGIMVLGCVRPASVGGDTVLVDGFNLAEWMRQHDPDAFVVLTENAQSFVRRHDGSLDQRCRGRTFALDDEGTVVGVRIHTRSAGPLDLPTDRMEPFLAAHRALCQRMMDENAQLRLRLDAGDFAVFDNARVLHSRTAFADTNRFLQICGVGRESFHERLRLLAARLGFEDEANMVLAMGTVQ